MLNECDIVSVRLFRADKKPGRLVRSTCRSRVRKSDGKIISEAEVFSNEMPIKAKAQQSSGLRSIASELNCIDRRRKERKEQSVEPH